ncbi:TetR/AcrR family transcriptional regulator [Microbacterium sp. GXF7504]
MSLQCLGPAGRSLPGDMLAGMPQEDVPPRTDGRRVRGEATKARVLAAASELFAQRGYSGTSINDIAVAAEVKPASIYHAFESKEGLLAAVAEAAGEEFFGLLEAMGVSTDVHSAMRSMAETFESHPRFLRLLIMLVLERGNDSPALMAAAQQVRTHGRAMVQQWLLDLAGPGLTADHRARIDDLGLTLLCFWDGAFVARQLELDAAAFFSLFDRLASFVVERITEIRREASAAAG